LSLCLCLYRYLCRLRGSVHFQSATSVSVESGTASLEFLRAHVVSMRYSFYFSAARHAARRSLEWLRAARRWSCDAQTVLLYYVGILRSCAATIGRRCNVLRSQGVVPRAATVGRRFGNASTRSEVIQHQRRSAQPPNERQSQSLARGGRQMVKMRAMSDRRSGNHRRICRCLLRMRQVESNSSLRSSQLACGEHLGALRDATARWQIRTACNGDAFAGTSADERGRGL
jgi:hypothetical protein